MDRFNNTMLLYRSVSLPELELIYDSGMKSFPARLPQQPIFYPVLELEYARQVASDWNTESGESAGYVTQFKVDDPYIGQFEKHKVGESQHQEFWIPAEELEEFNRHIVGDIKVVEAHFGDAFQGFIPKTFGLQGKNAVEQFTLLTNSYIYKRMDFYLEIRRNHKAVFLNYPFWQKCDFKNPVLKEKILQAVRDAWLKSSPKIPLPLPVHEASFHPKPMGSDSLADPEDDDLTPSEQIVSHSFVNLAHENDALLRQTDSHPLPDPDHKNVTPREQSDSFVDSVHKEVVHQTQADAHVLVKPVGDAAVAPAPVEQKDSHVLQGIELGLSGKYQEAAEELARAVKEDPGHLVAQTSLGVAFHQLGEDERALSCYEAALRLDPTYAEAHYFRANILYRHGNVREAIAAYTLALGLEPELIEAHQKPSPQDRLTEYTGLLAEMYWIAKPAQHILDLDRTLGTNPGQASFFKERAAEYYRLRNYVQAVADYSSYLAIQPDDASALHLRGLAYEQIEQFDRALEDYQRAIVINPQLSDVYIKRGILFGKTGNFRQSILSLTEGIRLAPRNPDGYFNRGTSHLQQGDFEKAIDDFSNAIRLSPEDEEAYYWRGISNEEAGRQRAAIADYRQFLAISQNPQARNEIEQRLSQWNEAEQNNVSSRSAAPDNRQKINQPSAAEPDQDLDLYDLIVALGERALHSTWFGSAVDCYGEKAEELYAFTDQNKPMEGRAFLQITSGIRQTIQGDFHAFDPGAASPWIFIRAWDGSGFYMEINDPAIREQLQTRFKTMEAVENAAPPYEGLFIAVDQAST